MTYQQKKKNWFALYTKPRHEFKVRDKLNHLSVQNYLPVITKVRQWNDRKKKIDEPLLRGYIFIYADEKERLISLENISVIKCVSDQGRPARIPEWQIDNLQNMLNHKGDFNVFDGLVKGTTVEIIEGPFKGVRGILEKTETVNNLAVTIDLLNRSVVVHLPKESVTRTLNNKPFCE
jgi:transcription antitermination factor NusG